MTTDDAVHLALAMTCHSALGALIWRRLAPIHRRAGRQLLTQAAQRDRANAATPTPG